MGTFRSTVVVEKDGREMISCAVNPAIDGLSCLASTTMRKCDELIGVPYELRNPHLTVHTKDIVRPTTALSAVKASCKLPKYSPSAEDVCVQRPLELWPLAATCRHCA